MGRDNPECDRTFYCRQALPVYSGRAPRGSEPEAGVHGAALRAARPIHVGVVGVHKGALTAAEDVILAGFGFEPFATKLIVNGQYAERGQERQHVEEEDRVRSHLRMAG